jgi:outer membrane biosynthesis protein TonB
MICFRNYFLRRGKMSLYDEIAKVAHELYEKSGRMHGRDLDNWINAERIVMARYAEKRRPGEEPMEETTEVTTMQEIPVEPFPQVAKVSPEEAEKEAPKKKAVAKKTTKKAEAKKEETKKAETKKVAKTKKTK